MAVYTKLDKEKISSILSNYNLGIIKKFEDTSMGLGIEVKYLIQRNYTAFPETSEEFDK